MGKKNSLSKPLNQSLEDPRNAIESIRLKGVRQNNLKNIDVSIPLGKYVVVTGLSGAGKSSLAFETLHAEGQRRYVETFSAYTRQFLDLLEKPDLDEAENIRPSIAIEQKNTVKTSRSTVGTMTELTDFFKVWFNNVAALYDPVTGQPIHDDNPQSIWLKARKAYADQTVIIGFEINRPETLKWTEILSNVQAQGYARFIDAKGVIRKVDDSKIVAAIAKSKTEKITIVQDRVKLAKSSRARFIEATETALEFGRSRIVLLDADCKELTRYSRGLHSPNTGKFFRTPTPALFSFNSPIGACPKCRGFGRIIEIDYRLAVPDRNLSIDDGLIRPFEGQVYGESKKDLKRACRRLDIPTRIPFRELSPEHQAFIIEGEESHINRPEGEDWDGVSWYGVRGFFNWLEKNTYKMHIRVFLSRYRAYIECPDCGGARLQPEALCWKWRGYRLPDLYELPVGELYALIEESAKASRKTVNRQADIAYDAIISRLRYLDNVGLGYLTLNRSTRTLSGGEVERVNLTSCLGASLVDTLFVLDEPSVGLHARDIDRLIQIIRTLTDTGNTVVVVEHDEAMIRAADHSIEIGPEPGANGGQVVFSGSLEELVKSEASITGSYLRYDQRIETPDITRPISAPPIKPRRKNARSNAARQSQKFLRLEGISKHNIENADIDIPLQRFVCVSGVSGSGKSTLLNNALYQNLLADRGHLVESPARVKRIASDIEFEEIVFVDQSPISRTPRSNPAVFCAAWDEIRKLYGALPRAAAEGYTASSFSFNAGDGRCEQCKGLGYEKIEMQFLSDVYAPCPHCDSKRFKKTLLEIEFERHSISDALELTISEAKELFHAYPKICDKLEELVTVGLGYLKMGQPLNTLSGGESQRLKLVKYLKGATASPRSQSEPNSGSLILLDEPTTGLHKHDVKRLLEVLQAIVAKGHSLVVIEHNLDLLKTADWIIELGPEAGDNGGELIFAGTPEACAQDARTETGRYLSPEFSNAQRDSGYALQAAEAKSNYGRRNKSSEKQRPTSYSSEHGLTESRNARSSLLNVQGARENNLRNISVSIPHYEFTVVTGVSGSGKSTLAFDIVFGEGQRRFMESMSPYARQFVEQLPRPDLDSISGIQPTVAIEQRVTRGSRKSTVATITEVAQYLRLLYSRLGIPHNPDTGTALVAQDRSELLPRLKRIIKMPAAKKSSHLLLCAPLVRNRKGHHQPIANWIADHGYEMMRVDGQVIFTEDFEKLDRYKEHNIEVVIADLKVVKPQNALLEEVLNEAMQRGRGTCFVLADNENIVSWLSTLRMDPETGEALPELDPKDFSFNSSKGWCPACRGHGRIYPWMRERLDDEDLLAKEIGADFGDDEANTVVVCPECEGQRLNRVSRNVKLYLKNGDALSLPQFLSRNAPELIKTLKALKLDKRATLISRDIVQQIEERLKFLDRVGLEYLNLDRPTQTLSGGEAQRIRLAAQLGSNLAGVLYVLDEPSIGLHARDGDRLIETLKQLKGNGNTLLVVEHDDAMMLEADCIIDLGPGAGKLGGEVIATGSVAELKKNKASLTGQYLNKGIAHPIEGSYRPLTKTGAKSSIRASAKGHAGNQVERWIELNNVTFRNLENQSIRLPHQRLVMVCGASGAGKSSLIRDLLGPAAAHAIKSKKTSLTGPAFAKSAQNIEGEEGKALFKTLKGIDGFRSVIEVDQSPIGKTPRSTPATYLGVFDTIRQFYASLPESKMRGYTPGRFSFNTAHGRCETCSGAGRMKLEMSFMPDTYVTCEDCDGRRYGAELLELHWKGKSIADVLEMSFEEAAEFFSFHSQLGDIMKLMVETGLGYLTLGQTSPTLSGGEAQRLKLVTELAKGLQNFKEKSRNIKRLNLYILEEPTIGLHLSDCEKLIHLLHRLVNQGHTVIVIEHHLDLIAEADYVVDIGPQGGPKGGKILYQGNLKGLLKSKRSITAPYLASHV